MATIQAWHSEADRQHRCDMIVNVMDILHSQRRRASAEWESKVPKLSRRIEASLYKRAKSLEAYCDKRTLRRRMCEVAAQYGATARGLRANGLRRRAARRHQQRPAESPRESDSSSDSERQVAVGSLTDRISSMRVRDQPLEGLAAIAVHEERHSF